jgi:hypothetical protein
MEKDPQKVSTPTSCDVCADRSNICGRCWRDELYHQVASNTHCGELHDLRAKDAAESSLFASPDGIRIKLFLRVDHGGYTTGDTFDIALTTYPNWHVSVAGKPHAVLGDFDSIYSNSLKAIVQSTLQFAVTRHDAVSGETEAMLVTDGAKETVLSLRMSFVNKPATDKEVSV